MLCVSTIPTASIKAYPCNIFMRCTDDTFPLESVIQRVTDCDNYSELAGPQIAHRYIFVVVMCHRDFVNHVYYLLFLVIHFA